jgi:hypothetical protein
MATRAIVLNAREPSGTRRRTGAPVGLIVTQELSSAAQAMDVSPQNPGQ